MKRSAISFVCSVLTASTIATAPVAETVNDVMTRLRETPQTEISVHLKEIIAQNECQIAIDGVEDTRTELATQLGAKMDVPAAMVPDVRGLLIDAFERGFNQMMREGSLQVDYATTKVTYEGCE